MKTENKKAKSEKIKKEKKPAKKFPAKKLPGLFKKSYSQKKFDKILKKIYIPEDKQKVLSMFSEKYTKGKKELIRVPRSNEYTKAELGQLKALAKNIKANKGRIKLLPFVALVAFIAAIGILVTVFKNPVAKMALRSSMQGIFGARCDIASVNVEIFGAQVTVRNLAQANPDEPMKNIFQFDKLDLNFNLTQLLRAKFHAENIEITGIALNTDRKTSGALPVKPKSAKEKAEKNDSTGFYDALKSKTGKATDNAKDALIQKLSEYNPETIMKNINENLQTKNVALEVQNDVKAMVENWKAKPAELQQNVNEFRSSADKLAKLNVNSLKTPADIKNAITQIQSAIESGQKVKSNVDSTWNSFEADAKKVEGFKTKIENAVKADTNMVKNSLPDLSLDGAKGFITGTFDEFAYSILGKYYPYLKQAISYAGSMKSNNSKDENAKNEAIKKAKKQARAESKRYAGRNVYWKKDTVPKLLIENVHGSGSGEGTALDIKVTNISSDMDKVGRPLVAKGLYKATSRTHNAGLTIDARSSSTAPLISGDYSGNNFPISLDFGEKSGNAAGVPSFSGTTSIAANLSADSDYSFKVGGNLAMNPVTIKAGEIPNAMANRIYSNALAAVKSMNVKANAGFSEKSGISLDVSTDADKIIAAALKSSVQKELGNVQKEAEAKLKEKLAEYTGASDEQMAKFTDIASKIKDSKSATEELNKQLDAKKKELEKKLTSAASSAATDAATKALGNSDAGKAAGKLLKGFGL
ncbi:TIGR03545 family protein [Treponema sp.]|uniref:TIGR03545 family protein n=1 Tax=Treponema sp. TaxID=166 RepID=UPI00260066A7|nr:TIGR03545 family protein [Treponema sp.]MBR4321135.1 TIGR03545 family protein [Treponema sp.]